MSESTVLLVAAFGAALLAGAGNAVAGGGSNISFPILVWLGVPPVAASATNTIGLWPGAVGAAWSYRPTLARSERRWPLLVAPAVVGGVIGAWLLLTLPPTWFGVVAPWMVITASVLVAVEPMIRRWLSAPPGEDPKARTVVRDITVQLGIAIYGGYFGSGIGILLLTALGLMGIHDLHEANAWKNVLAAMIKGAAVLYFAFTSIPLWPVVATMAVGSTLGGYLTGLMIQRLDQRALRWSVVAVGVALGLLLLLT